jgi:hypothetical protein
LLEQNERIVNLFYDDWHVILLQIPGIYFSKRFCNLNSNLYQREVGSEEIMIRKKVAGKNYNSNTINVENINIIKLELHDQYNVAVCLKKN